MVDANLRGRRALATGAAYVTGETIVVDAGLTAGPGTGSVAAGAAGDRA